MKPASGSARIPTIASWLLARLIPATRRDERLGDFAEMFSQRARNSGTFAARRWYWRQLAGTAAARIGGLRPRRSGGRRGPLRDVSSDFHWAWRALSRQPTFTLIAIVTLGAGIGINATVFSWLNAVLISPLPGTTRSGDLLQLTFPTPQGLATSTSYPDYVDIAASVPSLALTARDDLAIGVTIDDVAEHTWGEIVSGNFFDVLGVRPAAGRLFAPDDDRAGAPAVAVISEAMWRTRFGGAASAIGRQVRINGHPVVIVGVAPAPFQGGAPGLRLDLWLPISADAWLSPQSSRLSARGARWLTILGRQTAGATDAAVRTQLDRAAAELAATQPVWRDMRLDPVPLAESPTGGTAVLRPLLLVLGGMAALVLLVACVNVANLLLARGTARRRDFAVRVSLGASRARLVRQLLIEGLCLAAGGAVVTAVMLRWTPALLSSFAPPTELPVSVSASVDWRVIVFTAVVALLTVVLFALLPSLHTSRLAPIEALRGAAGSTDRARRGRLRSTLVVAQVGLSVALLVSAGLLVRSVARAGTSEVGFDASGSALVRVDLAASGYGAARGRAFYERMRESLLSLPGVSHVSLARHVPLGFVGPSSISLTVDGYTPRPNERVQAGYNVVAAGYAKTMGMRIVEGRDFTPADRDGSAPVVMINETMARRYWPGGAAASGRIRLGTGAWIAVVGIVEDVKQRSVTEPPQPFMYLSLAQFHQSAVAVHVRTTGDPGAQAQAVTSAIHRIDPAVVVYGVTTLDRYVRAATFQQRMAADLLSVFGLLALALAAIGAYGVLSYLVSQRRREIGLRMAIGASRADVFRLIAAYGVRLVGAGLAAGVVLAIAAGFGLQALLVGVPVLDPITYGGVIGLLIAVAMLACALPARRAAATNPMAALRE